MRKQKWILTAVLCMAALWCNAMGAPEGKVVVAYVTSWSDVLPDPHCMTHINYAFGHVNESFDGVMIDNEARLRQLVALKQQNPDLKVLLSVGGWKSGRFSEMAANDKYRRSFAKDCRRVIKSFGLDGIDIDWEYPTSSLADISSSPDDKTHFTLLMRDLRKALGNRKELTLASAASAKYIDFKAIVPYIDFVNVMAYDMASAPKHHSALYPSEHSGEFTTDQAVKAHLAAGVPPSKLVMGMPFYGRSGEGFPSFRDFNKRGNTDAAFTERWDDVAKVPYLANQHDTLVFGFENTRSLAIKCRYIIDHDLLGGMYWEYSDDNDRGDLRRTVADGLLGMQPTQEQPALQRGFGITAHQEGWDRIPPQAQKQGFYFQKSLLANMDDDRALEEVMLFGRDSGHYPTFDLFKAYYAIVDHYTKEIQYISDEIYLTDHYDLTVEDRNNDGISELYISYFKDGQFKVDERGYNLQTVRCYDRIEWSTMNKNFTSSDK